jgi:hypothetical protein
MNKDVLNQNTWKIVTCYWLWTACTSQNIFKGISYPSYPSIFRRPLLEQLFQVVFKTTVENLIWRRIIVIDNSYTMTVALWWISPRFSSSEPGVLGFRILSGEVFLLRIPKPWIPLFSKYSSINYHLIEECSGMEGCQLDSRTAIEKKVKQWHSAPWFAFTKVWPGGTIKCT